mmetsp:Transcript_20059/g.66741  ORF Transcript_20059/g.66741 Transcript_20059/m.66741 type:complete len:141 (+) Transcript_20059:1787-2209(+)
MQSNAGGEISRTETIFRSLAEWHNNCARMLQTNRESISSEKLQKTTNIDKILIPWDEMEQFLDIALANSKFRSPQWIKFLLSEWLVSKEIPLIDIEGWPKYCEESDYTLNLSKISQCISRRKFNCGSKKMQQKSLSKYKK